MPITSSSEFSNGSFEARALRPNPSIERTPTGKALGPRAGQCHDPPRGPRASLAMSAQLKRYVAHKEGVPEQMSGMPEGFWWNWGATAAGAAATFSAVLVALFGQAFRDKYFPPKLSCRLLSTDGEHVNVQLSWNEDGTVRERSEDARFYHLQVSNGRRWSPAREVQVVLLQVEEPGPDGRLHVSWTGAVPFIWRHQEVHAARRTIGPDADADLCNVVKGKWLALNLMVHPFNLKSRREEACTLVLTMRAQGNEGDSPTLRLKIAWDGQWSDGALEMRRHISFEILSGAT